MNLEVLGRVLHALGGVGEVGISPFALALAECQGDGHLTAGLEALAPETLTLHLHGGKRYGSDGVSTRLFIFLSASREGCNGGQCGK